MMNERTYEDLLIEIEVYKDGAELAKRDANGMRAKINELNKSYFKVVQECDSIERAYEILRTGGVNLKEEFSEWFTPLNVLETKINMYELQIKVLKNRVKELEEEK